MVSPWGWARGTVRALRAAVPARRGVALRAALCVAVPLTAGVVVGQPAAGAFASFGGLAGLYFPRAPFRYRGRMVAGAGAGLTLCVFLGAMVASAGWLAVAVSGVVAAAAAFLCLAAEVPPPRELMFVMALLAATDIPADLRQALGRAVLAAGGAVVAWLVTMSPALWSRRIPETQSVQDALGGIADLLDRVGTPDEAAARHAAVTGVRQARLTVAQGGIPAGHRLARTIVAAEGLLEAALHVEVEATTALDPAWGRAPRALARAVSHGNGQTVVLIPADASSMVGAVSLRAALLDVDAALSDFSVRSDDQPVPPSWPGLGRQVRAALGAHSIAVPAAARIGVAVAVGVGVGRALGLGHAYWVGLTAAAVLQGTNLAMVRRRFGYRLAGTVVGVGLAYALLGWHPPLWFVVVAAVAFQFLVELVIATHYGVAVVCVTVLALLLFSIGAAGEDIGAAVGDRLADTLIGAVLALLIRTLLWPRATSTRLPKAQSRALLAVRAALGAAWFVGGPPRVLADRRRRLHADLAAMRTIHADALADAPPTTGAADARWPVSVAIEELAFLAMSWPPNRPPPTEDDAQAMLAYLDKVASAEAVAGPPLLPGHPRTSAAVADLHAAVTDARRDQ